MQGTYSYVDPTGAIVTVNYNVSLDDNEQCVCDTSASVRGLILGGQSFVMSFLLQRGKFKYKFLSPKFVNDNLLAHIPIHMIKHLSEKKGCGICFENCGVYARY